MLLLDLPDELLVTIGKWVSCFDLKGFAHFRSSNRRLRELLDLSQPKVLSFLLNTRSVAAPYRASMTTLGRLYLYEVAQSAGLLEENRAGFDYGSPEVLEDDPTENAFEPNDNTYITGSETRLDKVQDILRRHRTTFRVVIDAHSGTGAPSLRLAEQMSVARGMGIVNRWFREFFVTGDDDEDTEMPALDEQQDEPSPVIMCAWSLEAADAAVTSNHPYAQNARTGRGWAELRLALKGDGDDNTNASDVFMVPFRPAYYRGLQPLALPEDWVRRNRDDSDDDNGGYGDLHTLTYVMDMSSNDDDTDDQEIDSEEEISSDDDGIFLSD